MHPSPSRETSSSASETCFISGTLAAAQWAGPPDPAVAVTQIRRPSSKLSTLRRPRQQSLSDEWDSKNRRSQISCNPYHHLPPAASLTLTSTDLKKGETLATQQ